LLRYLASSVGYLDVLEDSKLQSKEEAEVAFGASFFVGAEAINAEAIITVEEGSVVAASERFWLSFEIIVNVVEVFATIAD
jgi:hypothetical protein